MYPKLKNTDQPRAARITLPADIEALVEALGHAVDEISTRDLPGFVSALAGAQARAWLRLAEARPATPPRSEEPLYLDASQVAQRLNLPENWIRDRARRGKIPSQRIGHYVRFEWSKVRAAVEAMNAEKAQDTAS
jgi:hypothetical protein